MSVLDTFIIYKVNDNHMKKPIKQLLTDTAASHLDYTEDSIVSIIDLVRLKRLYSKVI